MAYDGAAGNVVLFGGSGAAGTLDDTWTWDGTTWTQQFPPVSPPARQVDIQAMAYDAATHTVVLFGGLNASLNPLGDTWTWDGIAKTRTRQFPVTSPSPRRVSIVYDTVTQTVVLFGGDNGAGMQYTDTWTWAGTTWTLQNPATSPSARTCAIGAYDASLHAVVLFGGYNGVWENSLDDTWAWNGTDWKQLHPATVPPNRYSAGIDYDPLDRALLLFGGYSSGPARGDTWLFTPVP
jgi:hypothetical protein